MSIKELWGLDSDEEEENNIKKPKSKVIYVPVDQSEGVKQEKSNETTSPSKEDEKKQEKGRQQHHHRGKHSSNYDKSGQKRFSSSSPNDSSRSSGDHYHHKKYDSPKQQSQSKVKKKYVPKDKADEILSSSKKPTQIKTLIVFDDPEIEGLKVEHEFIKTDSLNELEQQISLLKVKYKISQETEDKIFKALRENWKSETPKPTIQI